MIAGIKECFSCAGRDVAIDTCDENYLAIGFWERHFCI